MALVWHRAVFVITVRHFGSHAGFYKYGVVVQLLCSYGSNDCVLMVHFELFRLPGEVKTVDCGRNSESGILL